jgi:RNA polymerase sigma-70 factor (ECF subfamily)
MPSESTCWTTIRGAAAGDACERERFARYYASVLRDYFAARWHGGGRDDVEDAVQEVFVECFREGGALAGVRSDRPGGFRAFLYGVARNIALRFEARWARDAARRPGAPVDLEQAEASETSLSHLFDRAWARARLREAAERHADNARGAGPESIRRVELLRLRFHDGLAIRDIARLWGADAADLHRQYARARQEFKAALLEVVRFHHPGTDAEVERACADLLALLG